MLLWTLTILVLIATLITGAIYVHAHLYGEVRVEFAAIFYAGLISLIILLAYGLLYG